MEAKPKVLKVDFRKKEVDEPISLDDFLDNLCKAVKSNLEGSQVYKGIVCFKTDEGYISIYSNNITNSELLEMSSELQSKAICVTVFKVMEDMMEE